MNNLTDEQRAAIERIDSEPDDTPPTERMERIKGALSVSRQTVEQSLAAKEADQPRPKRGRKPKGAAADA